MAGITSALIVAGGAIVGGAISANAAKKASSAQSKAASSEIDFERQSRDLSLAYQAPQRQAGYAATAALMDMTGLSRAPTALTNADAASASAAGANVPNLSSYAKYDWTQNDPGYQFRLDQGNKAITSSLAARGGVLSGAGVKAALQYSQNYASNEYQNVYNRIASIAGFGQTATNASQQAITTASGQVSTAMQNAGDARASSYVAQGNAFSNAFNQIGSYAGYRYGYNPPTTQVNVGNYGDLGTINGLDNLTLGSGGYTGGPYG